MSEKEMKRRKIARAVMRRAWYTFRRSCLSWRVCLQMAWRTVRCMQPVYYSKVHGTTYENRQDTLRSLLNCHEQDIRLFFQREEDNVYDKNAIRIIAEVKDKYEAQIGYVSREWARRIAPYLDQGHEAMVLISQITGDPERGRFLGVNYEFSLT